MEPQHWQDTEIGKKAAVEWTLSLAGRFQGHETPQWNAAVAKCAAALQIEAAALDKWCRDKRLKPPATYDQAKMTDAPVRLPDSEGVADDAERLEKAIDKTLAPNVPRGAIPSAPPDLIQQMLQTGDALHDDEKAELAGILKEGRPLTGQQRNALATFLLSAGAASRMEIIHGIMDLVLPKGHETRPVWEAKETVITLGSNERVEHITLSQGIAGFPLLGRSLLIVWEENHPVRAELFMRAKTAAPARQLPVRQLTPAVDFNRPHVAMRLAMLASYVRDDERTGKDWVALFGDSKSLVSYHRRGLMDKLSELTGGKSRGRMPNMRSKPQRNKGSKRSA